MAASEEEVAARKGPSLVAVLAAFIIVTLVAAGAGALPTLLAMRSAPQVAPDKGGPDSSGHDKKGDDHAAAAKPAERSNLRELPPIVTNLASPADVWVRLEATLLVDAPPTPELDAAIAETGADTLAFMRTVSLAQLQGASGLQHLRQDLNERAAIRTRGKVREFIIHSLVVQ